jgi:hypothetical protein
MDKLSLAITSLLLCNRTTGLTVWMLNSNLPVENLILFFGLLVGGLILLYATVLKDSPFWQDYSNHLNIHGPAALAGIGLSFWP